MKENKNPVGRPISENPANRQFKMMITDTHFDEWQHKAKRAGFIKAGKGNISAWLKKLADDA